MPLVLHPDRYFDPDPSIRRVARALTLVARHQLDLADARDLARALAYDLARTTYKFDRPGGA